MFFFFFIFHRDDQFKSQEESVSVNFVIFLLLVHDYFPKHEMKNQKKIRKHIPTSDYTILIVGWFYQSFAKQFCIFAKCVYIFLRYSYE